MRREYGLSIKVPDEEIFKTGLFSCFEYCRGSFRETDSYEVTRHNVQMFCELSKKYNIAIRSFHLPFNDDGLVPFTPSSLDEKERSQTLENTKELIMMIKDCGIEIVVVHASRRVLPEERQQRLDLFVDYVQKLCDFCKPLGISVAVETLKPRCLGNCLKEHLYIMEQVNRDNVGICFDSNHLLEEDNIKFLEGAGQYVITTHFSDFDGIDEKHWYPGRGINDWKKIVEVLDKKGYTGPYVFEVSFPDGIATPSECHTLISEWKNIFNKSYNKTEYPNGLLFDEAFQKELKEKFYYADADPVYGERLFFENSGGSLRLKKCVEAKAEHEKFPDCPERIHERSLYLKGLVENGTKEILEIIFGAKSGSLITELTASQTMFHMVGLIMENITGTNAVVSSVEHPSAFDAVEFYCKKTGKEMRVVPANPKTGSIDPDEVVKYIDEGTCLLSIMSASNISGNIMDIETIVKMSRKIKPDLYIISDAVQHAPHGVVDVEKLQIDGMNFAPYKFFGVRGCGFAYVSDRVAALPHHKLIAKEQSVFELGTSSPGNFAAAMEIINYVCDIGRHFIGETDKRNLYKEGMRRIHLHERALLCRMLEGSKNIPGLRHIPGVSVCVDTDDLTNRDLIVALIIDGADFTECVSEYQKRGVTVYERVNTSIYSKRILEALHLEGAIRVSPLHCHGTEDIDKFLQITADIVKHFQC